MRRRLTSSQPTPSNSRAVAVATAAANPNFATRTALPHHWTCERSAWRVERAREIAAATPRAESQAERTTIVPRRTCGQPQRITAPSPADDPHRVSLRRRLASESKAKTIIITVTTPLPQQHQEPSRAHHDCASADPRSTAKDHRALASRRPTSGIITSTTGL